MLQLNKLRQIQATTIDRRQTRIAQFVKKPNQELQK